MNDANESTDTNDTNDSTGRDSDNEVRQEVRVSLILSPEHSVPVPARFSYLVDDPYAVHVTFHLGQDVPVTWVFARELLVEESEPGADSYSTFARVLPPQHFRVGSVGLRASWGASRPRRVTVVLRFVTARRCGVHEAARQRRRSRS